MSDREQQRAEVCAQFGVTWLPYRVVAFCLEHKCFDREQLADAIKQHGQKRENRGRYTLQQLRELAGMPQFRQIESGLKRRIQELEETVEGIAAGRAWAYRLACALGSELAPIQYHSSNVLRVDKHLSRLTELQSVAEKEKWLEIEVRE